MKGTQRFLVRLFCSTFNNLKNADVFILGFDHKVIFGDGFEGLNVRDGKRLMNVAQGFVYTYNEGKNIKLHFVTAYHKLLTS
jgi:hypothetical protein